MELYEHFKEFMNEAKALDGVHQFSSQTISKLYQSLEGYRRKITPCEITKKLESVASSDRFNKYLQARGWHEDSAKLAAIEVDQELRGLQTYQLKAQLGLDRLRDIFKDATSHHQSEELDVDTNLALQLEDLVISTTESASSDGDEIDEAMGDVMSPDSSEKLSRIQPKGIVDDRRRADYISYMALLLNMFQEDLRMKEKIFGAFGLDTPAENMNVYSTLWSLRPFVNEEVLANALRLL